MASKYGHNIVDTELQVIGGIIKDENTDSEKLDVWGSVQRYGISENHFSDPHCKLLFKALSALKQDEPNLPLDYNRIAEHPLIIKDKKGGLTRLDIVEYADGVASVRNVIDYHIKKLAEHYIASRIVRETAQNILHQIDSGGTPDLASAKEFFQQCHIDLEKIKAKPTISLSEFLEQKQKADRERKSSDLLGFGGSKFLQICKDIDGIQPGFYILGAHTNIGKTAFLTNLFHDILKTNPHVRGIYFSLDDSKNVIVNRLLAIVADVPLNRAQRGEDVDKAYDELAALANAGRIDLKDQSDIYDISSLELEIREKADSNLLVMIDGLYNLDVGGASGNIREVNIDRANKIKALADAYNIPIIVTGELRKRAKDESPSRLPTVDDLMETGKFAYNANLVWLLYPDPDEIKNNSEYFNQQDEPVLHLEFEKNKLSDFKAIRRLKFIRAKGIIEELKLPEY